MDININIFRNDHREDIILKNFSFGHCPNHLNLHPPNSGKVLSV